MPNPRALAFVMEPSALEIWTWHIISTTGWRAPNCEWCITVPGVRFKGDTSIVCFRACLTMSSQVWWGFWHLLSFWPQGHCLTKYPGFRQLMQCLWALRMAIICPCGNDLNFLQVYKGCLPGLQATQLSVMLTWYDSLMVVLFEGAVWSLQLVSYIEYSKTRVQRSRNSSRAV